MSYKVVFEGFEFPWQATEFARWYEGQGEQDSEFWLEEHGRFSANVQEMKKVEGNTYVKLNVKETY